MPAAAQAAQKEAQPFPSMGKGRDGVEAPAVRSKPQLGADTNPQIPARFDRDRHRPGVVARAKRLRKDMTLAEKRLWEALRKLDLHVRRQAPIGRFVADFAQHAARLVIEVDSPWHDSDEAQLRDAERDAWLEGQGYSVLRVQGSEVLRGAEAVAERIGDEIRRRRGGSAHLSPSPQHPAYTPTPAPPPSRGRGSKRVGQ
ncbi:MAG TPA: DUF559 domain-containing protein [Caulobacteraceae bacterium]|jgi:very-short-patch-repair endonuclease